MERSPCSPEPQVHRPPAVRCPKLRVRRNVLYQRREDRGRPFRRAPLIEQVSSANPVGPSAAVLELKNTTAVFSSPTSVYPLYPNLFAPSFSSRGSISLANFPRPSRTLSLAVGNKQQFPQILLRIEARLLGEVLHLRKFSIGEVLLIDRSLFQSFQAGAHQQRSVVRNQRRQRWIDLRADRSFPRAAQRENRQRRQKNNSNTHLLTVQLIFTLVLQIPLEEIEHAGIHLIRRRSADSVRLLRVQHEFELLAGLLERIRSSAACSETARCRLQVVHDHQLRLEIRGLRATAPCSCTRRRSPSAAPCSARCRSCRSSPRSVTGAPAIPLETHPEHSAAHSAS